MYPLHQDQRFITQTVSICSINDQCQMLIAHPSKNPLTVSDERDFQLT
jgi:hypothetical protein